MTVTRRQDPIAATPPATRGVASSSSAGAPDSRRPDFQSALADAARREAFPVLQPAEPRVLFDSAAYRRMQEHAAATQEVELCGVLVGEVLADDAGAFLHVTGAIPGEGAENSGAQVTFTQRTWEHVHTVRERDFPSARIVGWYHTHPGFGVFMSRMDRFIQEHFFDQPFQVAVVIDTRRREEGCFAWVGGALTALARYWVGEGEVRLDGATADPDHARSQPALEATADAADEPPAGWWRELLSSRSLLLATVLLVGFLGGRVMSWLDLRRLERELLLFQAALLSVEETQRAGTAAEWEAVAAALSQLQASANPTSGPSRAELEAVVSTLADSYRRPSDDLTTALRAIIDHGATAPTASAAPVHTVTTADVYLLPLYRLLGPPAPVAAERLTSGLRWATRIHLDALLLRFPEQRRTVEQLYPGLLDADYGPTPTVTTAGVDPLAPR